MTKDRKEYFRQYYAGRIEAKRTAAKARYRAKLAAGGIGAGPGRCRGCGGPMPEGKRRDAVFCSKACYEASQGRREGVRAARMKTYLKPGSKAKHRAYMREYMRRRRHGTPSGQA